MAWLNSIACGCGAGGSACSLTAAAAVLAASRRATAGAAETMVSAASDASVADLTLAASSCAGAPDVEAAAGVPDVEAAVDVLAAGAPEGRLKAAEVVGAFAEKGDCHDGVPDEALAAFAAAPPPNGGMGAGGEMMLRGGAETAGEPVARAPNPDGLGVEAPGVAPAVGVGAELPLAEPDGAATASPARAVVAPLPAPAGWVLIKFLASTPLLTSCVLVVTPIGVVTVMVLLAPCSLPVETKHSMR